MRHTHSHTARLNYQIIAGEWKPEPLSAKLHAVIADLSDDRLRLAKKIAESIESDIPVYKRTVGPRLHQEILDTTKLNLSTWYNGLLSGHVPFTDSYKAVSQENVRRRVRQGISLTALTQAYKIGARHYWLAMLDAIGEDDTLHHELLYAVSSNFTAFKDMHIDQIQDVYFDEKQQRLNSGQRARSKFIGLLLGEYSDDDGIEFDRLAASLHIDSQATYSALAFSGIQSKVLSSPSNRPTQLAVSYIARISGTDRDQLISTIDDGYLLVWIMRPHGMPIVTHDQNLALNATRILEKVPELAMAGVGLPGFKANGWRNSASQAIKAINVGGRSSPHKVRKYSDIAVNDAVLSSEETLHFLESMVERLSGEANLLETLHVYFELRQQRKRSAAVLNIHPNTLSYRLDRVEALLQGNFGDISWLSKLHLALQLRDIRPTEGSAPD